ncbi:hypothetical protein COZ73_02765 [Candidatus Falkowbacteria bacterium CG_4_8_14_3_um_filter_36_11]|nr:MAG: hypothetical protein COZ73_02765 [Candidatus Falkowbacteria bacterium CG_4_8_14_3_um_filter_36_11]
MYIIWNLTRVCPWNCDFCCVSAIQAKRRNGNRNTVFAEQKKKELTLNQKIEVLKMMASKNIIIDFSGGDPLYFQDDFEVVKKATEIIPSKMINISMTGCGITQDKVNLLKKVNMVEFTLDNLPEVENPFRPQGFNIASMRAMTKLVKAGVKVSAVTILYSVTITKTNLKSIYTWLCNNRIQEWDILKYLPVGRGINYQELAPTNKQYLATMYYLRSLNGFTHISFQHSLKVIDGSAKCHAAINSFGILPDGEAIACAWALDLNGRPINEFRIGKLPEENIDVIIERAHNNLGFNNQMDYCRVNRCAIARQKTKEKI